MTDLSLTRYDARMPDAAWPHWTALTLWTDGAGTRLLGRTRGEGGVAAWDVAGGGLVPGAHLDLPDAPRVGGDPGLGRAFIGGREVILTQAGAGLGWLAPAGAAGLTDPVPLPGTAPLAGLTGSVTIGLRDGLQGVYGGLAGQSGVGRMILDRDGTVRAADRIPDLGSTFAGPVDAVATAEIGGARYLFTASGAENGVTAWLVAANGNIGRRASLDGEGGLWIAAPQALGTVRAGGETYLVVAAAGSQSLSVMRVDADGGLAVTDHLLDDGATRFGRAQAMETVTVAGRSYVITGGGDDGIAVHLMLPGGTLVHVASLADTPAMGLADVSAIAARARGDGIDIFAASSTEPGITRISLDTGVFGVVAARQGGAGADLLTGTPGDDTLAGGAGHDVLVGGAGADILTGGTGRDLFVITPDGIPDRITDFTPGTDRIDLSHWPMLRGPAQLAMTATPGGFTIAYGPERLAVDSADGRPIDPATLDGTDLLGGTRIPPLIQPFYPGPVTAPPDLPGDTAPRTLTGGTGADTLAGSGGDDLLRGDAGGDTLFGGGGDDRLYGGRDGDSLTGGAGHDLIWGESGDDHLSGGAGDDRLFGSHGTDLLDGGDGRDDLLGGTGRDTLHGGAGHDRLRGGAEADRLDAGDGNDRLEGDAGDDRLLGRNGHDTLWGGDGDDRLLGINGDDRLYGGAGDDFLHGGRGFDRMEGGAGADTLTGAQQDDLLFGGPGDDILSGEDGRDRLTGGEGNDRLSGGADDDWMVAERGDDTLFGGAGDDKLSGGAGADLLDGGAGDDILTGGGGPDLFVIREGRDRVRNFEPGVDRLRLSGLYDDEHAALGGDTALFLDLYARSGTGHVTIALQAAMEVRIEGVDDPAILADLIDFQ